MTPRPRIGRPRRLAQPAGWLAAQTRADYPHRPDTLPGTVAACRAPAPRTWSRRELRTAARRLT